MRMNQYIKLATPVAAVSLGFAFPSFAEDQHDHKAHTERDHVQHEDHDHGKKIAGPNGGRILTEVDPHIEFYVTKDRKVKITAVDDHGKAISLGKHSVDVIAGDRKNPIRMKFKKDGNSLVSDKAFPKGDFFPVVVLIKSTPDAKKMRAKFNLNLKDCPSCDYLEYACTCDHGGHEGHDH